ncbi:MAG: hypothetical protein AB3N22_14620, partial [Ruegeria sp.]
GGLPRARGVCAPRGEGIVMGADGVRGVDRDEVVRSLDEAGLFLWVRERSLSWRVRRPGTRSAAR